MASKLLSRSMYLTSLQCPKLLWFVINDPIRLPQIDPATQFIFDQAHMVGELAKGLHHYGINIHDKNFLGNVKQTRELLKQRSTLFEAGILTGNMYARIDILKPAGYDEWDIIEVKSFTQVKDININDMDFQKYCCQQAGLNIRKCFLAHINNQVLIVC